MTQLTCDYTLNSIFQVLRSHCLATFSSCMEGCLVANVGNVSPTVARREGCQALGVVLNRILQLHLVQVQLKNSLSFEQGWQLYGNLSVKSSWTQQGLREPTGKCTVCKRPSVQQALNKRSKWSVTQNTCRHHHIPAAAAHTNDTSETP